MFYGLGSANWGSSPSIRIDFVYERKRVGRDMQYRVQAIVYPLTGSSYFGYPIYMNVIADGTQVDSVTMKNASPYQWTNSITHTTEWFTIPNKFTGTVPVRFVVYSGQGSSRANAYTWNMAVDPAASEVSASNGTLSRTLNLNVTRYNTSYTHTITYTCGSVSGTVCTNATDLTIAWNNSNGNVSALASQNTAGQSVNVTFTITTYDGTVEVGTNSTSVVMAIPDEVKPSVSLRVEDAAGYLSVYGAYVQGWSKLKATIVPTLAYESPIREYVITADGKSYNTSTVTTEPLQGKGFLPVTAKVTDARGRPSSVLSHEITVLEYYKPSVNVVAYRCNSSGEADAEGAYMRVGFTATIAGLNGKNSASYTINYDSTSITGKGTSYTSDPIACDVASVKSVEVTVTDNLSKTTAAGVIPIAFTLLDFHNSGEGVALGKVATRKGFDCAMDAYFSGKVTVSDKQLIDLIYPVGSIYMSINNVSPQTFFGGTWEAIRDRFLIGAGNTYSAGSTGGAAAHTLTLEEMPYHNHVLKVATSTSTASDAAWRASGVQAYSSQLVNSPVDNINETGASVAHNNMPPYLAVYMWKRTK